MPDQRKKLVVAVVALLALGIVGFAVFWFFVRSSPEGPSETPVFGGLPIVGGPSGTGPSGTGAPPTTGLAGPAGGKHLTLITNEPAIGATIDDKNKTLLYYRVRDGHLITNTFTGNSEQTLSNLTILNITEVNWSPNRSKAIVIYQDGDTKKQFITEATSTPKVSFLPQGIRSPIWSPDGKNILWLAPRNDAFVLVSGDTNGNNQKRLPFETPIPDLSLLSLTPDLFGLLPNTVSFFETPFFLIKKTSSAPNIPLTLFGLTAISDEDPKKQSVAYSATSRAGEIKNLTTHDFSSGQTASWPIKTLAEKCTFSRDAAFLFCAVPASETERGMPERWYQGKVSFNDDFYKIDVAASRAEKMLSDSGVDAVDLVANEEKSLLLFRDKKTGLLYSLPLDKE